MNRPDRAISAITRTLGGRAGLLTAAGLVGVMGLSGIVRPADDPAAGADGATMSSEVTDAASPGNAMALRAGMSTSEWDLPNLDHPRVDYWVDRFSGNEDMRDKFTGFLERSGLYRPMIERKLAERGMPQDLIYLAMIESGFQAHAYSHAAASGLWQFISETGQRYGLRVDGEVDERNDPEKATDAALDYLEDLHERFGSWYLAAAAYNSGEGRVGRVMRKVMGTEKARSEQDYYMVWSHLPAETRDYVPLMIAAGRIAKNPTEYGFDHVEPLQPLEYEVTVTDAQLSLDEVAAAAGARIDDLKLLNPQLKRGRLPSGERFALRLPAGTREAFEANWADVVPEVVAVEATAYRVKRGDNLTGIARRHGVQVSDLRRVNGLRSDRIYAGQTLKIESR